MRAIETRHHIGSASTFLEGQMQIMEIEGRSVGVVRFGERIFAMLNQCPHQMAEICRGQVGGTMLPSRPMEYEFSADSPVVRCPWHRWEFELETGRSFGGITRKRLLTFTTSVETGEVYLTMKGRSR